MTEEKEKLLAAAISQIEKDHGKGAIMRLGSRDVSGACECDSQRMFVD